MRRRIVVLDVESTGLLRNSSRLPPQLLQLGAIVATWPGLEVVGELSAHLRYYPERFCFESEAARVHRFPPFGPRRVPVSRGEHVLSAGVALEGEQDRSHEWIVPAQAAGFAPRVVRWLETSLAGDAAAPLMAAGWNVSFDLQMLRGTAAVFADHYRSAKELHEKWAWLESTWSHRSIDAFGLALMVLGFENSDQVRDWLGLDRFAPHDALEDARSVLKVLRAVRRAVPPRWFARMVGGTAR